MRLSIGHPRSALVVAPHPDDEIIGCYGIIVALRLQGVAVRILIASDGAASHPTSVTWPQRRLAKARRRESRTALRRLGVVARHIVYLDLADGRLAYDACQSKQGIARALMRIKHVDLIVGPTSNDAHPDHRAVAAALATIRTPARRLGYRVWPATKHSPGKTLAVRGGSYAKRSVLRCHRTQLGAIRDDPHGFSIARHELASFTRPVERYVELAS